MDDLEEFVASKWQTKFKRVFEPTSDHTAGRVLQSLIEIKEREAPVRSSLFVDLWIIAQSDSTVINNLNKGLAEFGAIA